MSLAKFQFIGNLTRDTEFNPDNGGRAVFDLAVNHVWYKDNVKQEETDFFRIKSFGNIAANAGKYLGKGSKVYIEGRIKPTKYERTPGNFEYGTDYIIEFIEYCDTKAPGQQ